MEDLLLRDGVVARYKNELGVFGQNHGKKKFIRLLSMMFRLSLIHYDPWLTDN